MATKPKVFIASSSEGLKAAKEVRRLLMQEMDDIVVDLWTWKFDLSQTYIESLEKVCSETDFAVLVLTPDDVTTSRKKKTLTPRDNVIFELGLFIGALGRKRCYIVNEHQQKKLKLPSDLVGVKTAKFTKLEDGDLKEALVHPVLMISEKIAEMGSRPKLSDQALAAIFSVRRFSDSIQGAWWERITVADVRRLSFFQIEFDNIYNAVHFRGKLYNNEGELKAHWKSVVVRILKDENKILYHWQGWYPSSPKDRFHGFGEMEFQKPAEVHGAILRGYGRYWDVDEAHPEKTVVKSAQLRRIQDKKEISTMITGSEKDRKALVIQTLDKW